MTIQNLALFDAIGAKMDYLNQRQRVISQNISNADTPGYKPNDLVDADFGRVLGRVIDGKSTGANPVRMHGTQSGHVFPDNDIANAKIDQQDGTYEVAPAGNAVIIEEQLVKSGQTVMDYNMMTNLLYKNVAMIKTAIGRGQ